MGSLRISQVKDGNAGDTGSGVAEEMEMIDVREIMTPRDDLVTLEPDATVGEAGALMAARHIRHIPVVNGEGQLVGIVSHRDVLAATGPKADQPDPLGPARKLSEIMSSPVRTVDPRVNVRLAGIRLRSLQVGCLAVMQDGALEGLVTDSDFVGVAINLLEQLEEVEPIEET